MSNIGSPNLDIRNVSVRLLHSMAAVGDVAIRETITKTCRTQLMSIVKSTNREDKNILAITLETLRRLWDPNRTTASVVMDALRVEISTTVVPLVVFWLEQEETLLVCARLLRVITRQSELFAMLIFNANVIPFFVSKLVADTEETVYMALGVLLDLCVGGAGADGVQMGSNMRRTAINDAGASPKFALLLVHPSERCRATAAICLVSMCTNGDAGLLLMVRLLEKMIIPNLKAPLTLVRDVE